jgi:phosphoribosylglycinamide formyltransferase-1
VSTQFVGEIIEPVAESLDARRMARGEPGLPRRFRWRGEEHEIADVLETRRETGDCRNGSGEKYVRKHWYRVRTVAGLEMKLSFDRSACTPRELRAAWSLHSITVADPA